MTDIERTSLTYEEIVTRGIDASQKLDGGRFELGDLACMVESRWGESNVQDFAKAINVKYSRVKQLRQVCAFWRQDVREVLLTTYPVLNYTHLRTAMGAGDQDAAMDFVLEIVNNNWTAEQAQIELMKILGKPTPPLKLAEFNSYVVDFDGRDLVLRLPPDRPFGIADIDEGQTVLVKIYEADG